MLNEKAPASLCYYFFLLLENKTARSEDASSKLLALIYGDQSDTTGANKNKVIYIDANAFTSNKPNALASAELFFGLLGSVSDDLDKLETTSRTRQARFVDDTGKYFKGTIRNRQQAGSLILQEEKEKERPAGAARFLHGNLRSFF